jgi:hypothetical protein
MSGRSRTYDAWKTVIQELQAERDTTTDITRLRLIEQTIDALRRIWADEP